MLNAADEVAVSAFLGGRIPFTAIAEVVERTLEAIPAAVAGALRGPVRRRRRGARARPRADRGGGGGAVSQILRADGWVLTIAGFAFLIILHEFGHFIAAKATGMRVERFFLFFPPKIVSVKRGETEYGIGALPFGGFVKITGMNPDEELPPEVAPRAYYHQPVWKRIVVIGAGPAMNLLLAFVILFAVSLSLNEFDGQVGAVESGTPAAAHLQTGDKLLAVDGKSFPNLDQQARGDPLHQPRGAAQVRRSAPTDGCKAKQPVDLKIERDGQVQHLSVTPFYDAQAKRMRLGFSYGTTSVGQSPPAAAGHAASEMWQVTTGTLGVFSKIFEPQERKKIHGIVGISDVTQQAVRVSAWPRR